MFDAGWGLSRDWRVAASVVVQISALLLAAFVARSAMAQPSEGGSSTRPGGEGGIDDFAVPGLPQGVLRFEMGSGYAPSASAGGSEVEVATPGGRLRFQGPISQRAVAQAVIGFGTSLYDVNDSVDLFADCTARDGSPRECPTPDEFYSGSFGAQIAYLLNPYTYVVFQGERFALVGEGFWRARWERGAFEDSLKVGTIVALGYDLPKRLRVAIGAQVDVALDGGNVSVQPTGAFRWDITPVLRLQNRGFGLQLQSDVFRRLELYAAGYRNSDGFRLHNRAGLPSGAEFNDRRWQVGAGFEWKLWRWLRLKGEAGAIVDRRLSVQANGEGTLADQDVDPSPYIDLRFEVRP